MWRLAARCAPPGDDEKTVALGGTLASGGEWIPPGGLEQFRLAACGQTQAENTPVLCLFCVLFEH